MSTFRALLSVTIPNGSVLDLSPASCNIGSFANFVFSPSALPLGGGSVIGLPSYAHRALFRVQVGTAAWFPEMTPAIGSYPNGSVGIITSAGDPKPVSAPGLASQLKLAALGGAVILNALFYEGEPVDV